MTPYMHCLVYHVPDHIRQYGNLRMFSGQGELGEPLKIVHTNPLQVLRSIMMMPSTHICLATSGMQQVTSSKLKLA